MDENEHVRMAGPSDAEQIAHLKVVCWRDTYGGLMPQASLDRLDAQDEIPHWRSWLEDPSAGLIAKVVEHEGRLLGYALAGPMRLGDRPGDEIAADAELYALYVHPDHQGKSIGYQLFASIVEALISERYQSLGCWMVGGNLKAENFYRKIDGSETGKRVEIRDGRIAFREKGWIWPDLKKLHARLTVRSV